MTTQAIAIQTLINYHTGAVRRVLTNRRTSMVIEDFTQIVNDAFEGALDTITVKKFIHIVSPSELAVTITKGANAVELAVLGVYTMAIKEGATPITVDIENPDEANAVKLLVIYD